MMTCIMALSSGMSWPRGTRRNRSACFAISFSRGSATISFAPRACALMTCLAISGWHSAVFEPQMKITSEC